MQLTSQTILFLSNDQTANPWKDKEIKISWILKELQISVHQFPWSGFILSQLSGLPAEIPVPRVIKGLLLLTYGYKKTSNDLLLKVLNEYGNYLLSRLEYQYHRP